MAPRPLPKMTSFLSAALHRGRSLLSPAASSESLAALNNIHQRVSVKATAGNLFPKVDPAIDGEDCDRDCESCTIRYPAKFKVEENDRLYGHVHGWATHILVATGKTDWVRDVEDEKGSVMEAVGKYGKTPSNGKMMLSASNIPVPNTSDDETPSPSSPTTVLLLPAFTIIENVTPASVPDLITHHISTAPTNMMPIPSIGTQPGPPSPPKPQPSDAPESSLPMTPASVDHDRALTTRPCPHQYLILLCSQRTRDARCGQSAPLLRREFERHLRPLGLYRDLHDERPGGVGIYFISHVGGHKYSANVMIYRRHGRAVDGGQGQSNGEGQGVGATTQDQNGVEPGPESGAVKAAETEMNASSGEASQCIWLARVRPEDCEGIVKFTLLQGKVVKPEKQLRGGFDREKGLLSW